MAFIFFCGERHDIWLSEFMMKACKSSKIIEIDKDVN